MSTRIIAVINQKGGVGKSTTADALLAGLTQKGFNCLGVDLDAQSNLTFSLNALESNSTVLEVLTGNLKASQAVQKTQRGDLIPASPFLSGADLQITEIGKEYRLKEALEEIKDNYDFIIIDTPPSLGILTVNALTASDSLIIPAQADIYSLKGIEQLFDTIETVKKYCNPDLKISGILLNRFSARSILSKEVDELTRNLAKNLGTKLFNTHIREAVAVKEAQIYQKDIFSYAPKANVTEDYKKFIEEFLEENNVAKKF